MTTLMDMIGIADGWGVDYEKVEILTDMYDARVRWFDDGSGRVALNVMTDETPRSTEPAIFPADPDPGSWDDDDAPDVPASGPPHPQGTDKLNQEGNPA